MVALQAKGITTGRGKEDPTEDFAESLASVVNAFNHNREIGNFYEESIDQNRIDYIIKVIFISNSYCRCNFFYLGISIHNSQKKNNINGVCSIIVHFMVGISCICKIYLLIIFHQKQRVDKNGSCRAGILACHFHFPQLLSPNENSAIRKNMSVLTSGIFIFPLYYGISTL